MATLGLHTSDQGGMSGVLVDIEPVTGLCIYCYKGAEGRLRQVHSAEWENNPCVFGHSRCNSVSFDYPNDD